MTFTEATIISSQNWKFLHTIGFRQGWMQNLNYLDNTACPEPVTETGEMGHLIGQVWLHMIWTHQSNQEVLMVWSTRPQVPRSKSGVTPSQITGRGGKSSSKRKWALSPAERDREYAQVKATDIHSPYCSYCTSEEPGTPRGQAVWSKSHR